MKTARELAHSIVCERQESEWCHWSSNKESHAHYCDSLTAAIEARDAEHAKVLDVAREALERFSANTGDREMAHVALSRITSILGGTNEPK